MRTNSSESPGARNDGDGSPSRAHVGVADLAVADESTAFETSGLGSCVAVAIYDKSPDSAAGGLLHAMLPSIEQAGSKRRRPVEKYVDSGIDELVSRLEAAGAPRGNLVAKVAGGSDMLGVTLDDPVGERNVDALREHLAHLGIPLVAEDVGGDYGRSVRFDPATGDVSVKRAHGDGRRL